MNTFGIVNDEKLVDMIGAARQRLIYAAPGISEQVAQAIAQRLPEQDKVEIHLILDLDPEVCRLGYGTKEGLELLQKASIEHQTFIRVQPGLRIGFFMSDDQVVVYTPTPQLVEAGSANPSKPNALILTDHPREQLARACGADSESRPSQAEIGRQPARPEQIRETIENLERLPPKPFDLARVQRVFSSHVQFVDIKVTGYKLIGRSVALPKDLLVEDRDTQRRLKNTFKLFDKNTIIDVPIKVSVLSQNGETIGTVNVNYNEKMLQDERKRLCDDWLISVHGFGTMVLRSDRESFDKEFANFKEHVEEYGKKLKDCLQLETDSVTAPMLDGLVKAVTEHPPQRYLLRGINMDEDTAVRAQLHKDLAAAYEVLCDSINPSVSLVVKEVSYETIKTDEFRKAMQHALKAKDRKKVFGDLFSEFDAARESEAK